MRNLTNKLTIVLGLIILSISFVIGNNIKLNNLSYELEVSAYENYDFEYMVNGPSSEQVSNFQTNQYVDNVVPAYVFEVQANNAIEDISVMFIEDMDDLNNTFFNNLNIIEENSEINGISIDYNLAEKLNLELGDTLQFGLSGLSYNLQVSRIYLPVNVSGYESGLVIMEYNENLLDYYPYLSYSMAFIKTNDKFAAQTIFTDYFPLGYQVSFEEFSENYRSDNAKPSFVTDERWEEIIVEQYDDYVVFFNSMNFGKTHTDIDLVQTSTISNFSYINARTISQRNTLMLVNILVFGFIYLLASLIFKKELDEANKQDGNALQKNKKQLIYGVSTILFVGIVLFIFFSQFNQVNYYFLSVSQNAWMISLNFLWTLVIVVFVYFYFQVLFNRKKKNDANHAKKQQ